MSENHETEETTSEVILADLSLEEINKKVVDGLAKVKQITLQISTFKQQSKEIAINNFEDKEGYKKTKEFLSLVRPVRTGLENERKLVIKPFNDTVGKINVVYKNCTSELAAIEAPHKEAKDKYETHQEEQKALIEKQREDALNARIGRIVESGLEFVPSSGYFKNDTGLAVTRMDIQNLNDEDFENLCTRAQNRKKEIQEEQQKEKERIELLASNKKRLMEAGIQMGMIAYTITDNKSGTPLSILFDDFEKLSPEEVNHAISEVQKIVKSNEDYKQELADKQRQQNEDAEKLKREVEDLKKQKVSFFNERLLAVGYKYQHAATIDEGAFEFSNPEGKHLLKVSDALADATLVDQAIEKAKQFTAADDYNKQEEKLENIYLGRSKKILGLGLVEAETTFELKDGISFTKDQIRHSTSEEYSSILEQISGDKQRLGKIAEEAENTRLNNQKIEREKIEKAQKAKSKKDLAFIDPLIAIILQKNKEIGEHPYDVIAQYARTLELNIRLAVKEFQEDTNHLRPAEADAKKDS